MIPEESSLFTDCYFWQPSESLTIGNDPRNEYNKIYTIDKLGNIWGGRPVRCMFSL